MSEKLKLLCAFLILDDSQDEEEEAALVAMLPKKKRKRRHSLFINRDEEGAYAILVNNHLVDNETKFQEYFRLNPYLFNKVFTAITLFQ